MSLSLINIPYWHAMNLLRVPAPILKTLDVDDSYGSDIQSLPVNLFAEIAPRLCSVHLHEVDLPSWCPALRTVTKLVYSSFFPLRVSDLHSLLVHLPLLDELQVSVCDGYEPISVEQPSELAINLHVSFGPGLESLLALFPRARAVLYDFTRHEHTPEPDPAEVAATVARALHTVHSPKSMLICWQHTLYAHRSLAIVLDGRKVIEHLQLHVLRPALTPRLMESVLQSVTRLTVPEELWDVFEDCTLPPNLDVTIIVNQTVQTLGYTPTGELYLSAPSVQKSIRSLALARPRDSSRDPYWTLSAIVLQAFVANAVTPGSLQSLVLHGIVLDGHFAFDSGEITVRTIEDITYPEVDAAR
ncbi:hypothetical protein EXIGLDRAFT_719343 [Exidia glandulosa HHB12029]|uniref:F-box domain-containing protein n=1 Tax=Exidia glandulosa HHB12029 TaxID=1314781 RepID=A0A165H2W4_EXIGL|nr:hypothetical protein EXIGLDRAFT_719343 [Exidia glandulosa HHB12029]